MLHQQKPFDLVVSRAFPWFAHIPGYWVASALGLPWVANFNDPWDFRPFISNPANSKSWNVSSNLNWWMRRTIAGADLVTFPCQRLGDYCLRGMPHRSEARVVHHIGAASGHASANGSDFVIVHAGKLGMSELTARPANSLLEGLARFLQECPDAKERTRLLLVGPEDAATMALMNTLGLAPFVKWGGVVSYERSLEHIAEASVCVLVEGDYPEGIFLPSKLCDYVVARKPVLALSPEAGTLNDLAEAGGIERVSPQDSARVSAVLKRYYQAFVAGTLAEHAPAESLVHRFEARTVIETFANSVRGLIPASRFERLELALEQ
jgi:hypothetical protein